MVKLDKAHAVQPRAFASSRIIGRQFFRRKGIEPISTGANEESRKRKMVLYNLGTAVVLSVAGLRFQTAGAALWLTVVLHAIMAVWCVTSLLRTVEITNTSGLIPRQRS